MSNRLDVASLRPLIFSAFVSGRDCLLCGADSRDAMMCVRCDGSLPTLAMHCARCAVPLAHAGVCARCLGAPPAFDAASARFEYRFPVDRLVHRFKYAGDLAIGKWLSLELAVAVRAQPLPDLLVPVPVTSKRLRERGFNQAAQIARVLSSELAIPVAVRGLDRVRDTPAQSALGRRARRANLRDAFRCARRMPPHVALVDDVITTGATAQAASRALKRAGASRVDVWAIARTPDPRDD